MFYHCGKFSSVHTEIIDQMQAGGIDSAAMSETPSSGSEDSECEQGPDPDDVALTEEWARELLADAGVVGANEVTMNLINYTFSCTILSQKFRIIEILFIILLVSIC